MKFLFKDNVSNFNEIFGRILAIVLLSILIRCILFFIFDYAHVLNGGDSSYYLNIGKNIMTYGVHGEKEIPTFFRSPLYSFFVGIVANVAENVILFYFVQSTIFICFSLLVYFLLCRYDNKIAFVSALLISISPFDALLNGRVVSENLVTPLIVLGTLCFIYSKYSLVAFCLSGVLLGALALTRDIYLLLPIFFFVAGIFAKIRLRYLIGFVLGFLVVIAPWTYRNSQLPSGGFYLSKGILWPNLWVGTWVKASDTNWYMQPDYMPPKAIQTFDGKVSPEIIIDAWNNKYDLENQIFFKKATIEYLSSHPLEALSTMIGRHHGLWLGTRSDLIPAYPAKGTLFWYLLKISLYFINAMLIFVGFLGIIISWRTKKLPFLLCIPIFYTIAIYFPFHNGETRYSQPVLPILTIFGVYFIFSLVDTFKLRRK